MKTLLLAVLIGLGLSVVIGRMVAAPLRATVDVLQAMAAGDFLVVKLFRLVLRAHACRREYAASGRR